MNLFFRKKSTAPEQDSPPSTSLWGTWRTRYNNRLRSAAAGLSRAEQKLSPHGRRNLFAACMALMFLYSLSLAWGLFPSHAHTPQHVLLPALHTPSVPSLPDSLPVQGRPPEQPQPPLTSPPPTP